MLVSADAAAAACAVAIYSVVALRPIGLAGLVARFVLVFASAQLRNIWARNARRLIHRTVDEVPAVALWAALATGVCAVTYGDMRAPQALALIAVLTGATVSLRLVARASWHRIAAQERVLLVGDGEMVRRFRRKLELEPGHHLTVVEQVDVTANGLPAEDLRDIVSWLVEEHRVDRIVVARDQVDPRFLRAALDTCRSHCVKLTIAAPLEGVIGTRMELRHLAEVPLFEYRAWGASKGALVLKRVVDVVVSGAALLVLSPLVAAIAIAIRLDSKGPALFRQTRGGLNGVPFVMLKFRTMCADADARLHDVVNLDELRDPVFKLRDDPRVTRIGRLLRRASLDELPQLWNVLRGDMSLVGPRPEEISLVQRYDERTLAIRCGMRPGVTGPMQIHGRGDLEFEERLAVESEYADNFSLAKDFSIMAKTVTALTSRRGAY